MPRRADLSPLRSARRRALGALVVALVLFTSTALAHEKPDGPAAAGAVVQGKRAARTASERKVTARALQTQPGRRRVEDLLRNVPGLVVVAHGAEGKGEQFFLRGFDAGHGQDVEVLVDGVRVNERSNVHGQGYVDLAFLPPEVVATLEARPGPFRAEQGPFAVAGSVRLQLGVVGAARGTRVGLEHGGPSRVRALALVAPLELSENTFFAVDHLEDAGFGRNREATHTRAVGSARLLEVEGFGTLRLWGAVHRGRFGLPGAVRVQDIESGRVGPWDAVRQDTGGASTRGLAVLEHHVHAGESRLDTALQAQARTLDLVEDYTGFLFDAERGDRRRQQETSRRVGLTSRVATNLPFSLRLEAGVEAHRVWLDQSERDVDAAHVPFATTRDLEVTETEAGGFVSVGHRPLPEVRLEAGVRVDTFLDEVDDGLTGRRAEANTVGIGPRASVAWDALPRLSVFAAAGRGLRPPEARAALARPSTGDTRREYFEGGEARVTHADAVEVGARGKPLQVLELGLVGFGTWIDRELVYDHVSGLNLELNPTRRLGGTADATWRVVSGLDLRGEVTLVDARFTRSGNVVPNAPRRIVQASAAWTGPSAAESDAGQTYGGARLLHVGARPLSFGAMASGWTVVDANLGRRSGPLALEVQVENLLDARWAETELHFASRHDPEAPRSLVPALHRVTSPGRTVRALWTVWY